MSRKTLLQEVVWTFLFSGLFFFQNGLASTINSANNGNWNDGATWEGELVPGIGDDVVIKHAVTSDVARTVNSLSIITSGTSGSLTGGFDLTVTGLLTIASGTLNNTGNTMAGALAVNDIGAVMGAIGATGMVTITGAATIGTGSLIGKTLELQGVTFKVAGTFSVTYGAVFRVGSSGTLTLANTTAGGSDFGGNFANPGSIDNQGTIVKNTDNAIFFLFNNFNNSGGFQINGGSIELFDNGGNFTGGSVSIASGALLKLRGFNGASNYSFTGGSVNGGGSLVMGVQAAATFSGSAGLSSNLDFTFAGGGGTVTDNVGLTPVNLTMPIGAIYQGTGAPSISGDLVLSGGVFNPGGNASIGGSFSWSYGDVGSSTTTATTVTVTGAVSITTSNTKGLYKKNLICQSGATSSAVSVDFYKQCQLTIPAGQVLNCNTASSTVKFGAVVPVGTVSGTLDLAGTLNKTAGQTLYLKNLYINNTGSIYLGAGTTQFTGEHDIQYTGNGSVEVASGATWQRFQGPNETLNYTNPTFINNGTLVGFDLKFAGSSQQTLAGTGTVHGLILDNSAGLDITGDQILTGNFTFINGKATINNNDLNLTSTGNFVGYSSSSYFVTPVGGRLVKPISFLTVFPVGPSTSSYNPVTISPSAASTFGVRVRVGFDDDKPVGGPDYVNRQWEVDRTTGSATAALTFQWNTPEHTMGNFSIGSCHVSHWNDPGWGNLGDAPVNGSTCPGGICARTQSGVSAFSAFGVASGIALPIELVAFRGFEAGPVDHFEWQTASESNTQAHHLQRSLDGIYGWQTIADRAAAGSANKPAFYEANDFDPPAEAYYRVLFERLDGKADASPIVFIKRKNTAAGQFSVFPNPAPTDGFWVNVPEGAIGQLLSLRAFDAAGRLIFFKNIEPIAGERLIFIESNWRAGAYLLRINSETVAQALPVLVR